MKTREKGKETFLFRFSCSPHIVSKGKAKRRRQIHHDNKKKNKREENRFLVECKRRTCFEIAKGEGGMK